jgi:hypothetical protein
MATRISGIIWFGSILEYSGNSSEKCQTETGMRLDWYWNKSQNWLRHQPTLDSDQKKWILVDSSGILV